jgi:hypothetical protein
VLEPESRPSQLANRVFAHRPKLAISPQLDLTGFLTGHS